MFPYPTWRETLVDLLLVRVLTFGPTRRNNREVPHAIMLRSAEACLLLTGNNDFSD